MSTTLTLFLIVAAVAATLYMMKGGVNAGLIMLADSLFVVIITRIPAGDALKFAFWGTVSYKTIKLILIMAFIMMLENIMRTTGMIKAMVDSLKEIVGNNRLATALMPAVIGLLPSPGGARFSCPMVDEVSGTNAEPATKAYINYWFRHVWMDGFILYPGVIIGAELLGVSVIDFFIRLLPFMVLSVIPGIVLGLKNVKKEPIVRTRTLGLSLKQLLVSAFPVLLIISLYIFLLNIPIMDIKKYSLEIASAVTVIVMFIAKKYGIKKAASTVKNAFPVKLVIIIVGVMVFIEILFGSGLMDSFINFIRDNNIPVSVLYLSLPFIGGLTSGIAVNFVSLTFPILIPLGLGENIWFAVLAFASGFIGCMVTPLHLCAVMTADYFKTDLGKMLLKVIISESAVMAIVAGVMFLIK